MPKQKMPNQRPEMFRKNFEENFGITVTPEKLFRFMNAVTQNLGSGYQPPSEEDTKAAAAFLFELSQAAKYGDSWNDYKERMGVRTILGPGSPWRPQFAHLNSPEVSIVAEYLYRKRKGDPKANKDAACLQIAQMHDRGLSTGKAWFNKLLPLAENRLQLVGPLIDRREAAKNSQK